jgi:hypothetical protein
MHVGGTNEESSVGDVVPQTDATAQPTTAAERESVLAKEVARLALAPSVLDDAAWIVHKLGIAGEDRIIRLLYLVMTSRLLDRPVSLIIKGESSGGKSFLLKAVLKLMPEEAYFLQSSVSPKLLVRTAESFVHRVLVFEEVAGLNSETEYFLRLLLSEGRIVYRALAPSVGDWLPKTFVKDGPTGLVVTTTVLGIHHENETRMLSVAITDTREQTRNVLLAAARTYETPRDVFTESHRSFQEWLSRQRCKIRIPFLPELAQSIAPVAMRIRRDFNVVVSLIEAHALLHQATRKRDEFGNIVATKADYASVHGLIADIISHGVDAAVPSHIRETVEAVRALTSAHHGGVPAKAVAEVLDIHKATASRRIASAIESGYLRNLEDGKGKPQRLVIDDPMPDGEEVLPHPDRILDGCTVAPNSTDEGEVAP